MNPVERHGTRMEDRMLRVVAVMALAVLAPQDSWQNAIKARNYERAAQLLHPIVMGADYWLHSRDPLPARQLAILYAQGLGVPRDALGACALARMAQEPAERGAAATRNGDIYKAALEDADKFRGQHCDGLLPDHFRAAMVSAGCFAFGMREEEVMAAGRLVQVGRLGIGFPGAPEHTFAPLVNCLMVVPRVRVTVVEPPTGAPASVRARHVIELFAWMRGQDPQTKAPGYALRWHAYEVTPKDVRLDTFADISFVPEWPRTPMLTDADGRVSMEMTRDGRVAWRLEGSELKGWLRSE